MQTRSIRRPHWTGIVGFVGIVCAAHTGAAQSPGRWEIEWHGGGSAVTSADRGTEQLGDQLAEPKYFSARTSSRLSLVIRTASRNCSFSMLSASPSMDVIASFTA